MNLELLQQPINKELKSLIVKALRRYSMYWPAREEAIRNSRVSRGNYKCAICKIDTFKRQDVQADHIVPAVNIKTGNISWYDLILFIISLFPPVEGWQICCISCHAIKTSTENEMRKFYRTEKKKSVSKDMNSLDKPKKK